MNLEPIYLSQELSDKLFAKLEHYNKRYADNPTAAITAQELAEKMLEYAIRHIDAVYIM